MPVIAGLLLRYTAKDILPSSRADEDVQKVLFEEYRKRFNVRERYEKLLKLAGVISVMRAIKKRHESATRRKIRDPFVALAFLMTGKDIDCVGNVEGRAVTVFQPRYTLIAREVLSLIFGMCKTLLAFCPSLKDEVISYTYEQLKILDPIRVYDYYLKIDHDGRIASVELEVWK